MRVRAQLMFLFCPRLAQGPGVEGKKKYGYFMLVNNRTPVGSVEANVHAQSG